MGDWTEPPPDWAALYWLKGARTACEELRAHLQLLVEVLSGDAPPPEEIVRRQAAAYLQAVGGMRHHLERLGWVTAQLDMLKQPSIDHASENELADFDRAIKAHPRVPVSLLLKAADGQLCAHMRVGTPPPRVVRALEWDSHDGEWRVGTHVGALPAVVLRYYEELADVDDEYFGYDADTPGVP
jgi:hypothetical protein